MRTEPTVLSLRLRFDDASQRAAELRGYLAGLGVDIIEWNLDEHPSDFASPPPVDLPVSVAPAGRVGGGVFGSLFGRIGVEVTNTGNEPIYDLAITPVGKPLIGIQVLGHTIPELAPGQTVPFAFEPDPPKKTPITVRISGRLDQTTLAQDHTLTLRSQRR
jgi:hypothetical protein